MSHDRDPTRRALLAAAGFAGLAAGWPVPAWADGRRVLPRRVVVVGSGIGGLATAALLARCGCEVHVLERHRSAIGGHGREQTIDGVAFSRGAQYLWHFGPGSFTARILDYLGIADDNPMDSLDPDGFERVVLGDQRDPDGDGPLRFDVPLGLDRYRDRLVSRFPDAAEPVRAWFAELASLGSTMQTVVYGGLMRRSALATELGVVRCPELTTRQKALAFRMVRRTVSDWFDAHRLPPVVRRIVYGSTILAERADEASALAFAFTLGAYHLGAHQPRHGFRPLFAGLARCVTDAGGSVTLGAEVTALVRRGRRIVAVRCADGTELGCDVVVSGIAPRLTAALIDGARPERYRYAPSPSILTVNLTYGPDARVAERTRGRNLWRYADDRPVDYFTADITRPPAMIYAALGRSLGPNAGLACFCPANVDQAEAIDADPAASAELRRTLAAEVADALDRDVLPGSAAHLRTQTVYTSTDLGRELALERAAIYGRRTDVRETAGGLPRPIEPVDNLFHVSAASDLPSLASGFHRALGVVEALTGATLDALAGRGAA